MPRVCTFYITDGFYASVHDVRSEVESKKNEMASILFTLKTNCLICTLHTHTNEICMHWTERGFINFSLLLMCVRENLRCRLCQLLWLQCFVSAPEYIEMKENKSTLKRTQLKIRLYMQLRYRTNTHFHFLFFFLLLF